MKRTHLPLNGLRVFDAAARHLSFTRAADELAVTPAAVGQQIRALEDLLGVVLFRRTPKGLELTPEAENGLPALRAGFLHIEESVRAMQAGQSSKCLTIAVPRDFAAKWLAARLAHYGRTDPDLRFVILASDDEIDFTEANIDVAIVWTADPGALEAARLGDTQLVTVIGNDSPDTSPVILWPGVTSSETSLLSVADAGLAIDAAAYGLGKTTVPSLLAAADIAAGHVRMQGKPIDSDKAYWLVAPLPQWRQKKVRSLVAALTAQNGTNSAG